MTKKIFSITSICLCLMAISFTVTYSQEDDKKLERPNRCNITEVDNYVNKSFDAWEESIKITEAVNIIKVEDKENSKVILNGKGETLSKSNALLQLGELMVRAKKQNDNIQSIRELQKPATESIKKASITKKPQASKNLNKGNEALGELVKETQKQIELIDKQIVDINEFNE